MQMSRVRHLGGASIYQARPKRVATKRQMPTRIGDLAESQTATAQRGYTGLLHESERTKWLRASISASGSLPGDPLLQWHHAEGRYDGHAFALTSTDLLRGWQDKEISHLRHRREFKNFFLIAFFSTRAAPFCCIQQTGFFNLQEVNRRVICSSPQLHRKVGNTIVRNHKSCPFSKNLSKW